VCALAPGRAQLAGAIPPGYPAGGGNVVSLLDTMRLTVLQQTAKSLPDITRDEEADYPLRVLVMRELERLKWFLWHGNVYKALQVVQRVEMDLDAAAANDGHAPVRKLLKALKEFHTPTLRTMPGLFRTMASATATANASARALWNRP
jgi:hypothetical protein